MAQVEITDPAELQKIRAVLSGSLQQRAPGISQAPTQLPQGPVLQSSNLPEQEITNPQEIADIRDRLGTTKTNISQELGNLLHKTRKGMDWLREKSAVVPAGLAQVGEDVYNLAAPKRFQTTFDPYKFLGASQTPLARGIGDVVGALATGGAADIPALGELGARLAPTGLKTISRFAAGSAVPQVALGAALDPSDRAQGALMGLGGATVGKALETPLTKGMEWISEKLHPKKWVQDKVAQIIQHRADLQKEADEGYGGVNAISHLKTIEMPDKSAENYNLEIGGPVNTPYGKIDTGTLKALQNSARNGNPSAKEFYDHISSFLGGEKEGISTPANKVRDIFSSDLMHSYDNSKLIPLDVKRQFLEFSNHPTLENADLLKQELNKNMVTDGASGADRAMNSILRNMKDELRSKFIHPTIAKYDAENNTSLLPGYKNAEQKFKDMMQLYGAHKNIDALSLGLMHRMTPSRLLKTLEPLQESKYYPREGLPLETYRGLVDKISKADALKGKVGLMKRLGAGAIEKGARRVGPLARTLAQYANIQQSR